MSGREAQWVCMDIETLGPNVERQKPELAIVDDYDIVCELVARGYDVKIVKGMAKVIATRIKRREARS